jgi:hypothetical protein
MLRKDIERAKRIRRKVAVAGDVRAGSWCLAVRHDSLGLNKGHSIPAKCFRLDAHQSGRKSSHPQKLCFEKRAILNTRTMLPDLALLLRRGKASPHIPNFAP